MDWSSIDTDMPDDPKIQHLQRKQGPEACWYYVMVLSDIARDIDFQNEENGYLDTGGDTPTEYLAWRARIDQEKAQDFLDTCADIGLICSEEWAEGRVFIPKLLERKQVEKYLARQKSGSKGGSKGKTPKRTASKPQANGKQTPSEREANGKQNGSNKDRDKEGDEDKQVHKYKEEIREVFDYFTEKDRLTSHRKVDPFRGTLQARLKDGWTVQEMKQTIDNYLDLLELMDQDESKVMGIHSNWTIGELFKRSQGEKANQILEDPEHFKRETNGGGSNGRRTGPQSNLQRVK